MTPSMRTLLEAVSLLERMEDKIRQATRLHGDAISTYWITAKKQQKDSRIQSAEDIIPLLATADPTAQGTYVLWLVKQWLSNNYRIEDLPRLRDYLDVFDRKRASIPEKDIQQYATPQDLLKVITPFLTKVDGPVEREDMRKPPNARVLQDDATCRVVEPLTKEAAAYWGHDSEWCITWGVPGSRHPDRENHFDSYKERGRFLIILDKTKNALFALHLSNPPTLWDAADKSLNLSNILRLPGLTGGALSMVDEVYPLSKLIVMKPIARRDRLMRLLHNGHAIATMRNPSPEERMTAIQQSGQAIAYITDPTPEERMVAIQQNGQAITDIPYPTPEERMSAVIQSGEVIAYIENPTPEERLAAVRQYGFAIEYIKKPTPEERMAAVQQNGDTIRLLIKPTPEERMAAIQQSGMSIYNIRRPTPEERMAAVQQDGMSLYYIVNPTPEERIAALQQNGEALDYIDDPTDEEIRIANGLIN